MPKKRRTKKQQNQEKVQPDEDSALEDIEVLSDGSGCSSNENDFTTLTSSTGAAYHPPCQQTSKSHYERRPEKDPNDEIIHHLVEMHGTLEKQKCQIDKLTSENDTGKEKLKKFCAQNKSLLLGLGRMKQTNLKGFVSTQIQESLMVESSNNEEKPDSTQPPSNKVYGATGSGARSVIIPCLGVLCKKKKRVRINNDSQPPSAKQHDMP